MSTYFDHRDPSLRYFVYYISMACHEFGLTITSEIIYCLSIENVSMKNFVESCRERFTTWSNQSTWTTSFGWLQSIVYVWSSAKSNNIENDSKFCGQPRFEKRKVGLVSDEVRILCSTVIDVVQNSSRRWYSRLNFFRILFENSSSDVIVGNKKR